MQAFAIWNFPICLLMRSILLKFGIYACYLGGGWGCGVWMLSILCGNLPFLLGVNVNLAGINLLWLLVIFFFSYSRFFSLWGCLTCPAWLRFNFHKVRASFCDLQQSHMPSDVFISAVVLLFMSAISSSFEWDFSCHWPPVIPGLIFYTGRIISQPLHPTLCTRDTPQLQLLDTFVVSKFPFPAVHLVGIHLLLSFWEWWYGNYICLILTELEFSLFGCVVACVEGLLTVCA